MNEFLTPLLTTTLSGLAENLATQIIEGARRLLGLRRFLVPLGAENLSEQGKEVDDQKMPETLVNTGFMLI